MRYGAYTYPDGGATVETMDFEPPDVCPFLVCGRTGLHRHPLCPACGAARYGNPGCARCNDLLRRYHQGEPSVAVPV